MPLDERFRPGSSASKLITRLEVGCIIIIIEIVILRILIILTILIIMTVNPQAELKAKLAGLALAVRFIFLCVFLYNKL